MEHSRRHGPFDGRWPPRSFHPLSEAFRGRDEAPEGLDWATFSSRYFAGSGRHDLLGIASYAAYGGGKLSSNGGGAAPSAAPS